jgi:hypothetical protein
MAVSTLDKPEFYSRPDDQQGAESSAAASLYLVADQRGRVSRLITPWKRMITAGQMIGYAFYGIKN